MKPACIAWTSLVLLLLGGAAMADDEAEREQLRQQRAQIEARYEASMHECAEKFRVTDCELAAKARRRAELDPVLKREQALDLGVRQRQADERRQRVAEKQQVRAKEVQARAQVAQSASAASAPRIAERVSAGDRAAPRSIDRDKAQAVRAEQAARRASQTRAATEQRIRDARQHEIEVLAREADLVAKGKRAAPLPLPSASEVSAAASAARR